MQDENIHVFIDESGDSGFKVGQGSTELFCIAAVIFRSTADIEATDRTLQDLRSHLGLRPTHEFHFHNEPNRFRLAFCRALCGCPFTVRAIVVDKSRVFENTMLRRSSSYFYNFITKMLLRHSFCSIKNAKVRIDGSMNRDLKVYLRRELNQESRIIHDTKFLDSRQSPMIQLADMVAGSIARSYKTHKRDCSRLREILKPCIEDIWDFGKRQK